MLTGIGATATSQDTVVFDGGGATVSPCTVDHASMTKCPMTNLTCRPGCASGRL